jgi:hypothetical protein
LGRGDEGLEFAVALADGVSKETEGCGVAGNTPGVLDDAGHASPDRVDQFPTAIMAVDLPAEVVAGLEVAWGGRSDAIPGDNVFDGRALEASEWFADVVTEFGSFWGYRDDYRGLWFSCRKGKRHATQGIGNSVRDRMNYPTALFIFDRLRR